MEQSHHSLSIGFVKHGGISFNVIAGAFIAQEQQSTVQNTAQVRLLLLPKHYQLRMCYVEAEIQRCQQTIVNLVTTQAHECTLPELITTARASGFRGIEGKKSYGDGAHRGWQECLLGRYGEHRRNLGV